MFAAFCREPAALKRVQEKTPPEAEPRSFSSAPRCAECERIHYHMESSGAPDGPVSPYATLRPPVHPAPLQRRAAAPVVQRLALMAQNPDPEDVELFKRLQNAAKTYRGIGSKIFDYSMTQALTGAAGGAKISSNMETIAFLGHGNPKVIGKLGAQEIAAVTRNLLAGSKNLHPLPIAPPRVEPPSGTAPPRVEPSSGTAPPQAEPSSGTAPPRENPSMTPPVPNKLHSDWKGSIYLMGCSTGRAYRGDETGPLPEKEKSLADRVEAACNQVIDPDVADVAGTFLSMYAKNPSRFGSQHTQYRAFEGSEQDAGSVLKEEARPLSESTDKMNFYRLLMEIQSYPGNLQLFKRVYLETTLNTYTKPIAKGNPRTMRQNTVNYVERFNNMIQTRLPQNLQAVLPTLKEGMPITAALSEDIKALQTGFQIFFSLLRSLHHYLVDTDEDNFLDCPSLLSPPAPADPAQPWNPDKMQAVKAQCSVIESFTMEPLPSTEFFDVSTAGFQNMHFDRPSETFHTQVAKHRREAAAAHDDASGSGAP